MSTASFQLYTWSIRWLLLLEQTFPTKISIWRYIGLIAHFSLLCKSPLFSVHILHYMSCSWRKPVFSKNCKRGWSVSFPVLVHFIPAFNFAHGHSASYLFICVLTLCFLFCFVVLFFDVLLVFAKESFLSVHVQQEWREATDGRTTLILRLRQCVSL